jgi:predicted transcriptional regulator
LNRDFVKELREATQIHKEELATSADCQEGYKAYIERGDPVWKDK